MRNQSEKSVEFYSLETMETMHLGYWDINWDFRFSLKKRKALILFTTNGPLIPCKKSEKWQGQKSLGNPEISGYFRPFLNRFEVQRKKIKKICLSSSWRSIVLALLSQGHPAIIPWVILADTGDQNISIFFENHSWGQNYYIWNILHREYRYRLKGC